MKAEKRFYDLARLILDIMGEGIYAEVPDFAMPEEVIEQTALSLQGDYERGEIYEDEQGNLYDVYMVDQYGGLYETEFIKHSTEA